MPLNEYTKKRNFQKTPEPQGAGEPALNPPPLTSTREGFFCVQRHDATRLHYDFRLEVGGVLVSWAVPKGPSLDPARKMLAMKVEDHPLEYGTFEGTIPKGNYGGGSVMLWDRGEYQVLGDPSAEAQLERGDFKFALKGEKLNGSFAIVRMKNRGKGNEWLLLKKKDEFAVSGYNVDEFAWSVSTHRRQDEIAAGRKAIATIDFSSIEGAHKAEMPEAVDPMLATAVTAPPGGDHWTYEVKWDGVRALCRIDDGELAIYSRRKNRCDQQYPEIGNLPSHVSAHKAWLDGEICVLTEEGRSSFELIQPRIMANTGSIPNLAEKTPVVLFLFDVLYVDGYDLRPASLEDRRQVLKAVVSEGERVRISETFETEGEQMFEAARQMKLEGIVAKDRRSKYEGARTVRWQKIKVLNEQEFLIAGFTKGAREYFGALVLGVMEHGKLRHAGQVGTGFDSRKMRAIFERLQPLVQKENPFALKTKVKDATWVRPEVVCQIRFLEWTDDGALRAPVFVAMRDDKAPGEVVREAPAPPAPEKALTPDADKTLLPSSKEATIDVDGFSLKFTNLEKIFFPKEGWKKRDLLEFYSGVAPYLLPHLHDRPLSLKRYPNGIGSDFFFQKNASQHFPSWMRCEPIVEHGGEKTNNYPFAQDRASLLYLVNLGCIDHNPLMSRYETRENPDWMLLDLDPVGASYDLIVDAAVLLNGILGELGLRGYPKTTGGDGLHIYVPLKPVYSFEQARNFAELLSHLAVAREPALFTTPRSVNKREQGRVYFDYLQIGSGKTIAAPYVVRAYDSAPVATPLEWSEVKRGLRADQFRIDNALARFREKGDIFAPVLQGGGSIERALERLREAGSAPASSGKPNPRKRTVRKQS